MRNFRVLIVGILVSTIAFFQSTESKASLTQFKPNEVIVKFKDGVRRNASVMASVYSATKVKKVKRFGIGSSNFEQLFLAQGEDVETAIRALEKSPVVEYAQPNYLLWALPVEEHAALDPMKKKKKPKKPRPGDGDDDGGDFPGFPDFPGDGGAIPCIPGFDIPGCDPKACLFPGFPIGCDDEGGTPEDPTQPEPPTNRPPVADKPAEVNPPVSDPLLDRAYGISKIGAPEAWGKTNGSQKIVVAVIDTGIDYNHEDLSFNMWRNPNGSEKGDIVGWDFIHNDNLPFDDNQHGSHCAGTIGGVGGNGIGVSGVNKRVSLMALKFLSGEGYGDTAGAIQAIDYAIANGARVLSNSWGGGADENNEALRDAIKRAETKGILFVAAAGNESNDNDRKPTYPAAFNEPNMLTVAATDSKDQLASFSNIGVKSVHLAAPGVGVFSSVPGNQYASLSGTSMACPHVAGAAALVWSANPNMSYKEVKDALLETVDPVAGLNGKTITGGRLNVAKAVELVSKRR